MHMSKNYESFIVDKYIFIVMEIWYFGFWLLTSREKILTWTRIQTSSMRLCIYPDEPPDHTRMDPIPPDWRLCHLLYGPLL